MSMLGLEVTVKCLINSHGYAGKLKVGDRAVVTCSEVGCVLLNHEIGGCWISTSDIALYGYPNPPRPHMHERIEYAKGADIQYQCVSISDWVDIIDEPKFYREHDYRVKPTQSEIEIKIAKLEAKLSKLRSEL